MVGTLEDDARPRMDGRSENPKRDFFVFSKGQGWSAYRMMYSPGRENAPSSGGIVRTERCIIVVAGTIFKSRPVKQDPVSLHTDCTDSTTYLLASVRPRAPFPYTRIESRPAMAVERDPYSILEAARGEQRQRDIHRQQRTLWPQTPNGLFL